MKKIDDKISEKVTSLVTEYICSSFEVLKNNELWKKAIKKACEATEGVDDSFADYIIKSPAIQRHFVWIMGNKSLNDLYRSFILTIAVERCAFNDEKKLAISLEMAILDNWFELNNEDYHDIRNQIVGDKIVRIVMIENDCIGNIFYCIMIKWQRTQSECIILRMVKIG